MWLEFSYYSFHHEQFLIYKNESILLFLSNLFFNFCLILSESWYKILNKYEWSERYEWPLISKKKQSLTVRYHNLQPNFILLLLVLQNGWGWSEVNLFYPTNYLHFWKTLLIDHYVFSISCKRNKHAVVSMHHHLLKQTKFLHSFSIYYIVNFRISIWFFVYYPLNIKKVSTSYL